MALPLKSTNHKIVEERLWGSPPLTAGSELKQFVSKSFFKISDLRVEFTFFLFSSLWFANHAQPHEGLSFTNLLNPCVFPEFGT